MSTSKPWGPVWIGRPRGTGKRGHMYRVDIQWWEDGVRVTRGRRREVEAALDRFSHSIGAETFELTV